MSDLTPNEIAVLQNGPHAIDSRRARSRAVNSLVAQKFLYGCDHTITPDGERAVAALSETCSTNSDILLEALQRITTIDMGKGALAFEAAQNIALEAISKATGEAK